MAHTPTGAAGWLEAQRIRGTFMKVTIVGGWSDAPQANDAWNLAVTDRRSFIHACRSSGRRLAEKRHTIVVGGDKHTSADYYVVEGFLSEFGNQTFEDSCRQVYRSEMPLAATPMPRARREPPPDPRFESNARGDGMPVNSAPSIRAVQLLICARIFAALGFRWALSHS
jgi:hypothetical protein